MPDAEDITEILANLRNGEEEALQRLISVVYQELRRLAAHYFKQERPDHTLQATALVHEVYLRLAGQESLNWQDRAHFFAAAALVMRNLLVDHARTRGRDKRGAGCIIRLDDVISLAADDGEVLAIDEALERLSRMDSRQARIVELRYFGGLSVQEVAAVLDISERTVKREWQMAKAWLYTDIKGSE